VVMLLLVAFCLHSIWVVCSRRELRHTHQLIKQTGSSARNWPKQPTRAFAILKQRSCDFHGTYGAELQRTIAERDHIHRLLLEERKRNEDSGLTQTRFMVDAMTAQKDRLRELYRKEQIHKIKTLREQEEKHNEIVTMLIKEKADLESRVTRAEHDRDLFCRTGGIPRFARPITCQSYSPEAMEGLVALTSRAGLSRTHKALYSPAPEKPPTTSRKHDDMATIQRRQTLTLRSVRRDRFNKTKPRKDKLTGLAPTEERSVMPVEARSPGFLTTVETETLDVAKPSPGNSTLDLAHTSPGEIDPISSENASIISRISKTEKMIVAAPFAIDLPDLVNTVQSPGEFVSAEEAALLSRVLERPDEAAVTQTWLNGNHSRSPAIKAQTGLNVPGPQSELNETDLVVTDIAEEDQHISVITLTASCDLPGEVISTHDQAHLDLVVTDTAEEDRCLSGFAVTASYDPLGENLPTHDQVQLVSSAENTYSEAMDISSDLSDELRRLDVSAVDDVNMRDSEESCPDYLTSGSNPQVYEIPEVLMDDVMTNQPVNQPVLEALHSQIDLPQLPLQLPSSSIMNLPPFTTNSILFAPATESNIAGGSAGMWLPGLGNGQSYMAQNIEQAANWCAPMKAVSVTGTYNESTVATVRAHSSTSAFVASGPCIQSTVDVMSASVPVSYQATGPSSTISTPPRPARRAGPMTMADSPRTKSFHLAEVEKQSLEQGTAIFGISSDKAPETVSSAPRSKLHPQSRKLAKHEALNTQQVLKSSGPVAGKGDISRPPIASSSREAPEDLRTFFDLQFPRQPSPMALQIPPVPTVQPMFQDFVVQTTGSQDWQFGMAAGTSNILIPTHFPIARPLSMANTNGPAIDGGPYPDPKQSTTSDIPKPSAGPDEQNQTDHRESRILAEMQSEFNSSNNQRGPLDEMDTDMVAPTALTTSSGSNSDCIPMEYHTEFASVSLQLGNLPVLTHIPSNQSRGTRFRSDEAAPPDGFAARIGFTNLNSKRNPDGTIIQDGNRQPKEKASPSVSRVVEIIQPSLVWLQKACRDWHKAKMKWGRIGAFDARERDEEMAWIAVGKVQSVLDQFSIAQEFMVKVVQRKKDLFRDLDHFIAVIGTDDEDMTMLAELKSKLMELKSHVREADQDAMDEGYQEGHRNDFSFTPIPGLTFLKNLPSSNTPAASTSSSHKRSAARVTEQEPSIPEPGEVESSQATASPGEGFQASKKARPGASATVNDAPASSVFATIPKPNPWVDAKSMEDRLLRLRIFCSSLESQINAWKQRGALTYLSKAEGLIHKQLEVQIREIQLSWKDVGDTLMVGLPGCIVRIYEQTNLIELCRWIKKDMKELSRKPGSHVKIMECMPYVRPATAIIESHQAEQAKKRNVEQVARDLADWEELYGKQGD